MYFINDLESSAGFLHNFFFKNIFILAGLFIYLFLILWKQANHSRVPLY